jgi:hypothetical protein
MLKPMKILFAQLASIFLMLPASAGESGLLRTFQPLGNSGGISVEAVTCFVSNFHSGGQTPARYISAANVPPNFMDRPPEDLNLASLSHIYFHCDDPEAKDSVLSMNAERFSVPISYKREDILKASLECLRRVLPPEHIKTELTFTSSPEDREWMGKIIAEFNQCDRSKEFFKPAEE